MLFRQRVPIESYNIVRLEIFSHNILSKYNEKFISESSQIEANFDFIASFRIICTKRNSIFTRRSAFTIYIWFDLAKFRNKFIFVYILQMQYCSSCTIHYNLFQHSHE